jgi:sulfatase maturation enzyme AslB (radical SAM superfamily)
MKSTDVISAWGRILTGSTPLLSIEITRECPLTCPGCYAYNDTHLGAGLVLRELSDLRGDDLVEGVIRLVKKHRPLHVSLVGGEPMIRHRELSRILPHLVGMGVWPMVVTSGVIPIPHEWTDDDRIRVTVSVDGLPVHHDVRRKPAVYERILKNIQDCRVNIHLTVTRPMMDRDDYLDEYFEFWNSRPETRSIWLSAYTPQIGEQTPEILTPKMKQQLTAKFPEWQKRFPKLMMFSNSGAAFAMPPVDPSQCTFATMSANYSADLKSRIEPCIFGGTPDCRQCGCAISIALHCLQDYKIKGPLKAGHFLRASMKIGAFVNRFRPGHANPQRWDRADAAIKHLGLVNSSTKSLFRK